MLTYKLDYEIERDIDRLRSVEKILDKMDTKPRAKDLELMATYLLYGKDENGKNAMQRKDVLDTGRRHKTYRTKNQKEESLDAIIENNEEDKPMVKLGEKSIYKVPKQKIEPEDRELGNGLMAALQDAIARLDHSLKYAEGKVTEKNPEDSDIHDSYHLYLLRHALIDMRRHQYYIKDSYRPAIHFLAIAPTPKQNINWGGAVHVKEGAAPVEFDYENYRHIANLIRNYSEIMMDGWEDPLGWERIMILDFDRYVDMAQLSPEKQYILEARIDKLTNIEIQHQVKERFGKEYTINYISLLLSEKIPRQISAAAARHRLELDTTFPHRQCRICGDDHPDSSLFFNEDGVCKKCVRGRRQWQRKGLA